MDWFQLTYQLLGGLALFFYGMKMLSDGLQSASSTFIRGLIASLTNNRFVAVLVGVIVTCLVQSSSITTVMVVGFVNAGLMQLGQAIGVIFGANIGTTITGWIISIKVGKYGFLFLAFGIVPIIFAKNSRAAIYGRVLFALGLIFIGLETMSAAFKPLRTDQGFLDLMTYFAADSFGSILATVAIGCALTLIIQSSSAMLGITIALASTGSISFQTAAALVMGENVGTTITALLACVGGNIHGKRAALAHACFNLFGVAIMVVIFPYYVQFIEWIVANPADFTAADGSKPYVAVHIAASHTIFNVANVCFFLVFIRQFARFIEWLLPIKNKQSKHLEFLGNAMTLSPPLAIEQTRMAIIKMAQLIDHMLEWTNTYVTEEDSDKLRRNILKYEEITDKIHQEVMVFVGHIMQQGISEDEANQVSSLLAMSDELESVADYCQKVTSLSRYTSQPGEEFDEQTTKTVRDLMNITDIYYKFIFNSLKENREIDMDRLRVIRDDFNQRAREAKDSQLERVKVGQCSPMSCLTVNDLINNFSRIISHSRKVAEAKSGKRRVWVY